MPIFLKYSVKLSKPSLLIPLISDSINSNVISESSNNSFNITCIICVKDNLLFYMLLNLFYDQTFYVKFEDIVL